MNDNTRQLKDVVASLQQSIDAAQAGDLATLTIMATTTKGEVLAKSYYLNVPQLVAIHIGLLAVESATVVDMMRQMNAIAVAVPPKSALVGSDGKAMQ
jgi:hypothetical protein